MPSDVLSRRRLLGALPAALTGAPAGRAAQRRPNVLFIAVDDMRDWTAGLGGYRGHVRTPHQDRLARRGVLFTNAHCPSPVCNPSRTAILLGQRPSTTGIYNNGQWWRPALPNAVTIPMHFRANGYHVAGGGKLFHHTAGFNPPGQWDEYFRIVFDDPWYRGSRVNYPWVTPAPAPPGHPLNGIPGRDIEFDWGPLAKPEEEFGDVQMIRWAERFLGRRHARPFFLGAGIFHPHLPWYIPRRYLDMYPPEEIRRPEVRAGDLEDVPEEGRKVARATSRDYQRVIEAGQWDRAIQCYLASITFADALLGRLLDALDNSSYARNTVVVFWSDHGWHLGEKEHWHKHTLWEAATRVPFLIAAPGVARAGSVCRHPVGLIDIYPTLNEVCGLPARKELDGQSLTPLLRNPDAEWKRPALTTRDRGQHAVRTERWRYIRYSDGSEELYDHGSDPHEWVNLAAKPELAGVKRELAAWLPKQEAAPQPGKNAYEFDYGAHQWKLKSK